MRGLSLTAQASEPGPGGPVLYFRPINCPNTGPNTYLSLRSLTSHQHTAPARPSPQNLTSHFAQRGPVARWLPDAAGVVATALRNPLVTCTLATAYLRPYLAPYLT